MDNPEPLSERFEYRVAVSEDEIDAMNHVNNLQYLRWTNRAAIAHSSHVGWTPDAYEESGCGFIVRSHAIKYRVPALLNDEILVTTWIADFAKVSSLRKYRITRESGNKLLATAETNWVYVDFSTLELTKIPSHVRDAFIKD
jgi:acyl-CoA thioester hydrolase